jgi:hypothetical protein
MDDLDDHDHGLGHDLHTLLGRRRVLKLFLSGGTAGLLAGCDDLPFFSRAEAEVTAKAADGSECVAHPRETAGPFPADGSNRAHGTLANVVNAPPPKGGGFSLRLKAGSVRHSADSDDLSASVRSIPAPDNGTSSPGQT